MVDFHRFLSGLGRRLAHREEPARKPPPISPARSPARSTAAPAAAAPETPVEPELLEPEVLEPEVLEPGVRGPAGVEARVLGRTARTTVDNTHVVDGQVKTTVLHDVLVKAGVGLDSNDMQVVVGSPRLLSSNLVTSPDGKFIDREQEIEVKVVIKTKERLSLFVDALAGASVEPATLTLTPRAPSAPVVTTAVENADGTFDASAEVGP